ncbi:hypothetical protein D3C76_1290670 [compost metagenome]
MQHADQPGCRLYLQGNGQLQELFDEHFLLMPGQVEEPAAPGRTVHLQVKAPSVQVGYRQRLVIALHRVEPGFGQPRQRFGAVRATVDQVADTDQAVRFRVEIRSIQALLQALKMAVDVAHGQVASLAVGGYAPKPAHYNLPQLPHPGRRKMERNAVRPGGASCVTPLCVPCSWRSL